MANIRITTSNDADAATLTAVPAVVATLPVTNLQDQARERVMRTTSVATQDIKFTWALARWLSSCVLDRHNLSNEGTWRLRLYSDPAWTTLVFDSGTLPALAAKALGDLEWGIEALGASLFSGWPVKFSKMYFALSVVGSGIVTIADTSANPDAYMEASRLMLGRYIEPQYNFEWGLRCGWVEDTGQERTEGGTLRSDGVDPNRRMSFRLEWISLSDRPKLFDWARATGRRADFFVDAYPEEAGATGRDYAMRAKMVESPFFAHKHVNDFTGDYTVEEA